MREFDVNGDIKSTTLAGPPSGAAGGDLTGTYPSPTVITSGLVVKVPNTIPDGQLRRNHADTAWICGADSIVEAAGPTALVVGTIADGGFLVRSGATVVGHTKPTVAGIKVDAVAASILAALVTLGLVTDTTT